MAETIDTTKLRELHGDAPGPWAWDEQPWGSSLTNWPTGGRELAAFVSLVPHHRTADHAPAGRLFAAAANALPMLCDAADERDKLRSALDVMTAKRDALKGEADNWQGHLDRLLGDVARLKAERDEWKQAHNGSALDCQRLRSERDSLRDDCNAWRSACRERSAERDRLIAERDALVKERDALKAERDKLVLRGDAAKQVDAMRKERDEARGLFLMADLERADLVDELAWERGKAKRSTASSAALAFALQALRLCRQSIADGVTMEGLSAGLAGAIAAVERLAEAANG